MLPVCPCQLAPKAFGQWVRQERAARGLKQKNLAALLKLRPEQLCRIENGRATRSLHATRTLIHFFTAQGPHVSLLHRGSPPFPSSAVCGPAAAVVSPDALRADRCD